MVLESQLPHKTVKSLFTISIQNNKLTALWGGWLSKTIQSTHGARQVSSRGTKRLCGTWKQATPRLFHVRSCTSNLDPGTFPRAREKVHLNDSGINLIYRCGRCAALKERCPPRQKSRVERLKAKAELFSNLRISGFLVFSMSGLVLNFLDPGTKLETHNDRLRFTWLNGGVPREQMMLKGHPPRESHITKYTSIRRVS